MPSEKKLAVPSEKKMAPALSKPGPLAFWVRLGAEIPEGRLSLPRVCEALTTRGGRKQGALFRLLSKCRIMIHHCSMARYFQLIVYFSCPQCEAVYAASQKEQPEECSGDFRCRSCGATVHKWTGIYDFPYWKPLTPRAWKARAWKPRR